jgi:hypothetical protein
MLIVQTVVSHHHGRPLPLKSLKAILHSKRANVYYLEHCRVMQKDGRVLYLTEGKDENYYWNIPIANTTVILLGTGTSITPSRDAYDCQRGRFGWLLWWWRHAVIYGLRN